jgi:CRISPR-associated protein Csy1
MNSDVVDKVSFAIKSYIDDVDDKKIADRTQEKIHVLHTQFTEDTFDVLKGFYKENIPLKESVAALKKSKPLKGASRLDKIEHNSDVISKLIDLIKHHDVFYGAGEKYKDFLKKIKAIRGWNKYEQWIDWALDFGEESYLATHIAKLTHSSSKGSSVDVRFHLSCNQYDDRYICTKGESVLDTAYPDNKYSSISKLYTISISGNYLGDLLHSGNEAFLGPFTKDEELLKYWMVTFASHIKNETKKSYFLSKQVYFPVVDDQYHLLLPLTSSSLVHALHLEHKKYGYEGEDQKQARKQKYEGKYSETVTCTYPNKAYLHVTGSNHSNVSSLNGNRGGRVSLLPTMPPQWLSRLPSYKNRASVFDKDLSYTLSSEIDDLRRYLLLIKNKTLSISEPRRNAAVVRKLQAISENLFNYVETISNNETDRGWSIYSKLPDEQQLLFEPSRQDDTAKALKVNTQWQKSLSKTYGLWLNRQLNKRSPLKLTSIHQTLWTDCFLTDLKEMIAIQEVTL